MKIQNLLKTGYAIPIVFWLTLFFGGLIYNDYHHFRNLVSELGTIGSKTQYLFTTGLVISAILSVFFGIGLLLICKLKGLNKLPVYVIFTFTFSIAGAAIFPLPLRMHLHMGMPSILLFLSPLLAAILWNKKIEIKKFTGMTLLVFFIMSLGFLSFFPDLWPEYPGLKQRFFHVGWTVWFIYLSFVFTRLSTSIKK